ncbi:MAG TPA: hypothetical protein VGM13_12455 [Thermoanaerobaculia bacterium]|jgi:hypothetical protein
MTKRLGPALALLALLAAASAPAVEPASDPRPAPLAPRASVPIPPRAEAGRTALDSIVTSDAFLPAVHINGASGVFRTDVWIFNPDPNLKAGVDLYYTEADRDGSALPGIRITPDLDPRESVTLSDIVKDYFGKTSSYGLLEVRGSLPLIVTSNTFNVAGATPGTYGQFSPGQAFRNALGFDTSIFGDLYVTGLFNDPNHRTNAVVMNPTGTTLEAGVQLVDSVGNVYKTVVVTVAPWSLHQLNDIFYQDFASSNPPQGGPWRLNVYVDLSNGAKVLCYATVTDLRTGDPYLVPGQAARP